VCMITSVRKVKGEGSVWGDLVCFVNLPYFLVRYVVVPIMDCVCVCVFVWNTCGNS
jgi:hypothetical protein